MRDFLLLPVFVRFSALASQFLPCSYLEGDPLWSTMLFLLPFFLISDWPDISVPKFAVIALSCIFSRLYLSVFYSWLSLLFELKKIFFGSWRLLGWSDYVSTIWLEVGYLSKTTTVSRYWLASSSLFSISLESSESSIFISFAAFFFCLLSSSSYFFFMNLSCSSIVLKFL